MNALSRLPRRLRATLLHLLASGCLAAIVSVLVFGVWYPYPYGALTGSVSLFALLTAVDVTLGPVLTAVVANKAKPGRELARDIAMIGCVQLAALGYGLHTIAVARPVVMAFEVDRMRVVSAIEIMTERLPDAPAGLRQLPWTGPKLIAARKPSVAAEQARAISLGLGGIDLSMVPAYWVPYDEVRGDVIRVSRPASDLLKHYPEAEGDLRALAVKAGASLDDLRFLPLVSRRSSWVTLVAQPDARIVGHLPLDGFF